jgi:hypothetical protein
MLRWWFWLPSAVLADHWARWLSNTWGDCGAAVMIPGRLGGSGPDGWFVCLCLELVFNPRRPWLARVVLAIARAGFWWRMLKYGGRVIGWERVANGCGAPAPVPPLCRSLP